MKFTNNTITKTKKNTKTRSSFIKQNTNHLRKTLKPLTKLKLLLAFKMARCCAVIQGDGISGSLIFHQVQTDQTISTSNEPI